MPEPVDTHSAPQAGPNEYRCNFCGNVCDIADLAEFNGAPTCPCCDAFTGVRVPLAQASS